ncbi:MAG: LamG-like jellyroll fold domain-containing protein [Cyclobacteriaceae bacterium]
MFSSPFLQRSILLTMLFAFSSLTVLSQIIYVDANTGDDSDDGSTPALAKLTIQAAINIATSGDRIIVAAGTYAESLTIDENVSLEGPNVSIAGDDGSRLTEAIIEPSSQDNAINVTAADVTIVGFQIGVVNVDAGIGAVNPGDLTIQNNVINADSVGVSLYGSISLSGSININDNLITLSDFETVSSSTITSGIVLYGLSGSVDVSLSDNVYSGGAQGIFVFGCLSSNILDISNESITDAIRGMSVFSWDGNVTRASSTLMVNNMTVASMAEPITPISNFPQAGIYFYTDGSSTDSHIITATVDNSTFSDSENSDSDYAGIICGDFSSADYVASLQDITINESTFSDNENRGIQIRGQNTNVSINRSTFQNNGFDPYSTGGNHGFHVVVRNDAIATIANSIFVNPPSQTNDQFDGLSIQSGSSLTITNSFFNQNGNGMLAGTSGINLSSNYFSSIDESEIDNLVGSGNDFTPWIANSADTDMGTAGFQPDLDSLYVGTSGTQTGSTGRVDEAISLVDANGSIIINAGTYTETVSANKAVNLLGANVDIPASSPRIAETIINPGSLLTAITVTSNAVTIDGIQLGNSNVSSNANIGIAAFGFTNANISNNIIHADSTGLQVGVGSTGSINVDNNHIEMLGVVNSNTYASIGISAVNLSNTIDLNIEDNDLLNASFGIIGFGLTSDNVFSISGGDFSGCTQGIVITNTDGGGNFSRSIAEIEDVTMSAFVDPGGGLTVPDAQAGIYIGTFSDGSTTTVNDSVEVSITNVDISGTGDTGTDYAAINVVDFGGVFPFITNDGIGVNVAVTSSNLHDNLNRGFTLRGVNATATLTRNTLTDNTNAGVVVSRLGYIELNNNFITNPGTGTPRALVAQTDGTMTARDNNIDAGNGSLADGQDADDKIDLSRNYLGTTVEGTISGLVDNANSDFTPWIASGTDTNPSFAGFQPDLSTLHVGSSGDQTSGDRIQEGHDLVDTLGTVIINTADYDETLTVTKDISIDPAAGTTIDNITTNGGDLSILADFEIENTLTLTDGVVDMDLDDGDKSDDPVLTLNGAVAGSFSDDNHVEGKLAYQLISGTFDFPVGDDGEYRPVVVAPTNFPSSFEVAHVAAAPSNIASLQSLIGTGSPVIQSVLEDRYWTINTSDSPGSTDVTLQVSASDMEIEPGVLSMVRDNAGTWEEQGSIMESGTTIVDVEATATGFGDFSLISAFGMAPGNVSSGLQMWLKADAGTSTTTDNTDITLWSDMSGVGTDAEGTTNFPLFRNDPDFNFNFNPVIVTNGVDDTLATIIDPIADSDDFTLFMVSDNEDMVTRGASTAGDGWSIRSFSSVTTTSGGVVQEDVTGLPATSTPTIHTLSFDQGASLSGYRNGTAGTPDNSVGSDLQNSTDSLNIGIDDTNFESGSIAELIMYNAVFSGTERERIESYLAIKYGITLSDDYLASDGGTVWNTTTNAGYNDDIAGIGRDDFSGLDQRKSRTINADSLVTMALDDLDAPMAFADNDAWLVWGNDDGLTTFTASIDNANTGTSSRMERIWRVQETGTVGTVELALNETASAETVSLIVHPSDDTFPNDGSRQVYEMVYSSTTDDYRVTVDLTNGDYFTFAEGPVGGIPAVLISEVITDPQQQWQESGFADPSPGGAGPYDSDDDWVELYVTENNLNLTNWSIEIIDGTNVEGSLFAGGAFAISNYNSLTGGLLQATDSGDFIILGEMTTGAMNPSAHIVLRDENGDVVDQVRFYASGEAGTGFNGNSDDINDESVTRLLQGTDTNDDSEDFVQTVATLGSINSPSGTVMINEVVSDPQQDWKTSGFVNTAPGGSGANNDEWIELYIETSGINLTGWTIDMIDGSDRSGTLEVGGDGVFNNVHYVSSGSGSFTSTAAGDYFILGDPVGDMDNDVLIVLYDPSGTEIDRVQLGGGSGEAPDGDAGGTSDESVARYTNATDTDTDDADFIQTRSTLGSTNTPTGTVLINEVVVNPEQDWSAGGFTGIVGSGTPSSTDDWVELFIGTAGLNLTNWSIEVSLDNFSGALAAGEAFQTSAYFGAGSLENTEAGDYYVMGNPQGTENIQTNAQFTLRDDYGNIVDQLQLGGGTPSGTSTGIDDESVARIPNATDTDNDVDDFIATTATLGRANSTAPVAQIGNALDFDGTEDYVVIPDAAVFDVSTTFSVEAWVYLDAYNPTGSIVFDKWQSGSEEKVLYITSTGTVAVRFFYNISEALDVVTTTTVATSTWTHIAATFDSGTGTIYINGVEEASGTLAGDPADAGGPVYIGGSASRPSPLYHDGLIDELRVWSDVRTQEELLENINSTIDPTSTGLIAYYRFDQSTGTSLPDLAGANDGTLVNMDNDDWITADWPVYAENSTIVQSASGNQGTAGSGQLSIVNSTFLSDNDDILLVGHESSDFDTVATELPTNTLVTNRYARSWHLTKNDAAGSDGGLVTISFEIGTEPDSLINFYLLERTGISGDFEVAPIVGYQPGSTSVDFTVEVDSLTDEQYYTLGWSDPGAGNVLDFAGSSNYVTIADDNSLDLVGTASWEFWMKVDDITDFHVILDKRTTSGVDDAFTIGFNLGGGAIGSNFGIEVGGGFGASIDRDLFVDDTWHHVVIVFDKNATDNFLFYLDGLPRTLETSFDLDADLTNSSQELIIGRGNNATGTTINGSIDEVRIWSDVRTQSEILNSMYTNLVGDESNLVAYYRFNEGIGNDPYNLPDISGNNNNGQLVNFDNLDNTTATSNYVLADRGVFEDNVVIINTDTDILTNSSDELALTSTTSDFLQDDGDFIRWGHDGGDFSEVATDLPANSNLAARISKTWNISKGDVSTNDGLVTFAFNLDTPPDPDYTYYLLQRSGSSGDFSITEVLGAYPDTDSIKFTVDASQIVSNSYYTLGRSVAGPGHALDFDGANDHISVSDNADLDITVELTLESWVSLNALPPDANEGIVAKYLGAGDQRSYSLEVNTSGNVVFNISDDGTDVTSLTSATVLATDQMTQVSAVYDPGNSMSIYINGVLDATSSTSIPASIFTSTADLWIGATTEINADSLLNGVIDEVRIWDDVRTVDEINDNIYRSLDVANESNLVAYYKFDDGIASGTNTNADSLADYSDNDHVGVLTNLSLAGSASNWLLSEVPLADESVVDALDGPGNALSFDGDNDHVIIDDADELDITGAITLEAWVNLTTTPSADNEGIVSKYLAAGNEQSYSLEINTSGNAQLAISANGSNRAEVVGSLIVPTGEWTHIVGAFEPSGRMAIYVNGILDNEITSGIPTTIYSGSADVWIGASEVINADNAIEASVDEVRIWDVARTTVEIQDNMFKELVGDESGLVAYYVFDELDATTTTTLPDLAGTNDGTLTNMADPVNNWVSAASREPFKNLQIASWNAISTWKSSAVPDAITAVSDVNQDVTLASPVDVDFLNINSGVTLTLDADITVNGNLINNGAITGDGTLVLVGTTPRIYGGTVGNLQLSSADVTLKSNTTIAGELDLSSNSTLNIDDYDLTINTITGFSETAFIETKDFNESAGFVIKSLALADGDFTFPIGSSGSYTPLTVKNLGTTGNIQARVFDDTYAQGTSGVIIDTEKEVNKSWEINGDAGVNVTITLQWNSENEDPNYASARSSAYLSKNNYDWWRKVTPDVGVTGSDPYQITASGIQTFSVFGTGTENSSLPVTWMAFEAFENEDQEVELHWSTASELNNDRFEIEKSFDGRTFHVIGQIVGNGTTNSLSDYQFIDTEPFNGINYYRLRQVDYDGADDYSELVSVFVDVQREYNITLSPNPTFDVTTLSIEWESDDDYAVGIFDMMGRKLGVVHSKFSKLNLDLSTLPKGMYIIKIHTGDRVVARKLIKH